MSDGFSFARSSFSREGGLSQADTCNLVKSMADLLALQFSCYLLAPNLLPDEDI